VEGKRRLSLLEVETTDAGQAIRGELDLVAAWGRWPSLMRGSTVTSSSCQGTVSGSISMIRRFGTTAAK
jgi:hypothetical protein